MHTEQLHKVISEILSLPDGAPLLPEQENALREMSVRYPYFPMPLLLMLRHMSADASVEERNALKSRIALACTCKPTLGYAAAGDKWANFYPPQPPAPEMETNDVIDTFLRTFGTTSPAEEALLERMIFNPTPDYAEMLAREEQMHLPAENPAPEEEEDEQQSRINAFIRGHHPAKPRPIEKEELAVPKEDDAPVRVQRPEHSDDSLLSESLAKIYIKRGRYERAHEIISSISLKYPKKSAYFADQLRFLQKLIINQRCAQAKNEGNAPKN